MKIQKKFLEFKFTYYKTPIGLLKITGNNYGISSIIFIEDINKLEQFKNIILGKSFISLRLIDWLLTHFAKNTGS